MSQKTQKNHLSNPENPGARPPNLWKSPLKTLFLFTRLTLGDLSDFARQNKRLIGLFSLLLSGYFALHFLPFFTNDILQIDEALLFVLFWTCLGVLSSIGLGTGLHTFVLYLGPKIVRFVIASHECGHLAAMLPSRFSLFPSFSCRDKAENFSEALPPTFWNILRTVQLEAFLWGFGTAIGELPPYVISRAARLQGSKAEELEALEQEQKAAKGSLGSLKFRLFGYVRRNAFVTVLALASFPNPLFDLAGLTCGHLLVPFWTFFIATAIGKAVIKVHLQVASIIFIFSRKQIDLIVNFVKGNLSAIWGQTFAEFIEKQRKNILTDFGTNVEMKENWLGFVWNALLTVMIGYFVISIVNSRVNQHYADVNKIK